MDCEAAFETMSAALDGELELGEVAALRAHLGACTGCRTRRRDLVDNDRVLRSSDARRVRVPARLRARVHEIAATPSVPLVRQRRFVFVLTLAGGAVAGGIIVAIFRPATVVQTVVVQGVAPTATRATKARAPAATDELENGTTAAREGVSERMAEAAATAEGGTTPAQVPGVAASGREGVVAPPAKELPKAISTTAGAAAPGPGQLYAAAAGAAGRVAAVPGGGVVRGVVELEGPPPPAGVPPTLDTINDVFRFNDVLRRASASVTKGRAPRPQCSGEVNLFRVKDRRLADVHVSIAAPSLPVVAEELPPVPLPFDGCAFAPRVMATLLRQSLYVQATDGGRPWGEALLLGHLAGDLVGVAGDPLAIAMGKQLASKVNKNRGLDRAGVYQLRSGLPGGEKGVLVVSETPFFAVTDDDGSFSIAGVPAGRHQIRAWHEGGGERVIDVNVRPNEVSEVRLAFKSPELPSSAFPPSAPPPEPKMPVKAEMQAVTMAPTADEPCQLAAGGESPVARACAEGGRPRARAYMRSLVVDARGRRGRIDCDTCHLDRKTWALRPEARARLSQVLVALGRG